MITFSFDSSQIIQFVSYAGFMLLFFYGAKLQLMQMLAFIKNKMTRLGIMRDASLKALKSHILKHITILSPDQEKSLQILINSIAIPPVSNLDPQGLVPKMENIFKTYDLYLKKGLRRIVGNVSQSDLENLTNSLEVAIELNIFYKVVDHFYRLAKKGDVMMAYMLKMGLAQLMEMGEALFAASSHFQSGLPIGDTFGPMVGSKLATGAVESNPNSETSVYAKSFEDRRLVVIKAKGPGGSVGDIGSIIGAVVFVERPSLVVTVDAGLKMESEKTGEVNEGVGVAMGGNGTDRFRIEEALSRTSIPVLTLVCKMTMKEAISLMPKAVLDQVDFAVERVKAMIRENSEVGQTVIVIGVGNTMGTA